MKNKIIKKTLYTDPSRSDTFFVLSGIPVSVNAGNGNAMNLHILINH